MIIYHKITRHAACQQPCVSRSDLKAVCSFICFSDPTRYLMWAAPEIAPCKSWRLCVMWCVKLMICGRECQVCADVVSVCAMIEHFFFTLLFRRLIALCVLSRMARQSLSLVVTCRFSLCETWWISSRCSTCSLHLWFRKPRTEAKDSLCGVGGNVDLCVWTREPTQTMTRSCPIIPTPSLFLLLTRTQPLDYCVPLNPHFFSSSLFAPYSPVLFT